MKIGTNDISKLYVGSTEVSKAYVGSTEVWSSGGGSDIPEGYTRVSYIATTGAAYLAPDYTPTQNDVITLQYNIASVSGSWLILFGCRDDAVATSAENAWLGVNSSMQTYVRFGTVNPSSTPELSKNTDYTSIVDLTACTISFNSSSYSFSGSTLSPSREIYIGRMSASNALSSGGSWKYAGFSAVRSGTTILNLIPCTRDSDSVAGVWDTVSQTFLTSASSTAFTAES